MPVTLRARITGERALNRTLEAAHPGKRPQVVRGALTELAGDLQRLIRTKYLTGPAPRRLERETGRTIRGIVVDRSGLPRQFVDVGSIAELWWLENYELGRGRRGHRPFLSPAVNEITPQVEAVFARHWRKAIETA